MGKYIKYLLAVATLLIVCATFALADEPATVVATVNGVSYFSLADALSNASSGDCVRVVSDTSFSTNLVVPVGCHFILPSGITISTASAASCIFSYGLSDIYGRVVRSGSSGNPGFFIINGGVTNFYGSLISSGSFGDAFYFGPDSDGILNIYGGFISGYRRSLSVLSPNSRIYAYGGTFSPMFSSSDNVVLANGSRIVDGNSVSWGGLYEITQIVLSAVSWISLFCAAIVANKLLLIFILFFFGFVAIGCIKRIIND